MFCEDDKKFYNGIVIFTWWFLKILTMILMTMILIDLYDIDKYLIKNDLKKYLQIKIK